MHWSNFTTRTAIGWIHVEVRGTLEGNARIYGHIWISEGRWKLLIRHGWRYSSSAWPSRKLDSGPVVFGDMLMPMVNSYVDSARQMPQSYLSREDPAIVAILPDQFYMASKRCLELADWMIRPQFRVLQW